MVRDEPEPSAAGADHQAHRRLAVQGEVAQDGRRLDRVAVDDLDARHGPGVPHLTVQARAQNG